MLTPLDVTGVGQISLYFISGTSVLLIRFMKTGFVLNRIERVLLLIVYGGYVLSVALILENQAKESLSCHNIYIRND